MRRPFVATRLAAVALLSAGGGLAPVMSQDCGTVLTPQDVTAILANAQAGLYETRAIAGFNFWYIPTTMHVVRRSNGSGGLSESRLSAALNDLNAPFSSAGMIFYRSGPTRFIDDDAFFLNIDTIAEIDALRQTDVVFGTVNLYFTQNLDSENGSLCGISSFTTSSVQGVVMKNDCVGISSNHSTFPHEVGHYFDLFHTHETVFGAECVDGSNCGPAGDLVCDTPADPELSDGTVNGSCVYTGSQHDSCSSAAYSPQTWNLMSYSRKECRNDFTGGQRDRARATIENLRPELSASADFSDAAIFVNSAFPDGGTGTPFFPFDVLGEGLLATPNGGCLIIGAGNYLPALTLNRPMSLHASLGAVRIGG